jgi:hypothetical protein
MRCGLSSLELKAWKIAGYTTQLWLIGVASIGLSLRLQHFWPMASLPYQNWLHAHSHLAFLGWLFNGFYLHFTIQLPPRLKEEALHLFWVFQLLLIAIGFSFILSGYSTTSIVLTSLHTVGSVYFGCRWFYRWRHCLHGEWVHTANWAVVFMLLANLGPVGVAFGKSQELPWLFDASLHYYLYFNYTGWFTLAALAVWQQQIRGIPNFWSNILAIYSIVYYCISTFLPLDARWYASPIVAILLLVAWCRFPFYSLKQLTVEPPVSLLIGLSLIALVIRTTVEWVALWPAFGALSVSIRAVQIGYLHVFFLGIASAPLMASFGAGRLASALWVAGSWGSWLVLLGWPWLFPVETALRYALIGLAALLLVAAIGAFLSTKSGVEESFFNRQKDKNGLKHP